MKNFVELIKKEFFKYFKYTYAYIFFIVLLIIIVMFRLPILAFIALVCLSFLITYDIKEHDEKQKKELENTKKLSEEFDSVTKHAIFNMPNPMVVIDNKGYITWQNEPFTQMVGEVLRNVKLSDKIPDITMSKLENERASFVFSYKESNYKAHIEKIEKFGQVERYIVYIEDVTEYLKLEKMFNREKLVLIQLFVDNLDEVKSSGDEGFRAKVQSTIDTTITDYFAGYSAVVRKYEQDKFFIVTNRETLNKLKQKKFDILDTIRDLEIGNTIPITLSMGVSDYGENALQIYERARASIDIALGRGGDQAVVTNDQSYDYFGGKTKSMQKDTKVKARVIAYALRQLIDDAENIFICGHKNPDMDSFASTIGIYKMCEFRGKKAKIVLNDDINAIKSLVLMLNENQPELNDNIITSQEMENNFKSNDLLILCDHHRPSLSTAENVLENAENVIIIDHHRRGDEFLKNPSLVYLEPHASSASELVTEILQYISDNLKLTYFESSALLSGIMLDTKNFTVQTGVRTFDAARVLVKKGADPEEVKLLFRDNIEVFTNKAKALTDVEIYKSKFAISKIKDEENAILIAAQAGDAMLNIEGVEASFALCEVNDYVHISARSFGEISVQLIMEKIGGGGHISQAGARLETNLEDAMVILKRAIDSYEEDK